MLDRVLWVSRKVSFDTSRSDAETGILSSADANSVPVGILIGVSL